MKWYPPIEVAQQMVESNIELKVKMCPIFKINYLTSPNVVKWLTIHEGTEELTMVERGKKVAKSKVVQTKYK